MDRKLISHRIGSILDDISRLSNALYALDTTDIQRYPDNYETLSIDAALRAERIACRLRHLIYSSTTIRKGDYLKSAGATHGITVNCEDRVLEVTPVSYTHLHKGFRALTVPARGVVNLPGSHPIRDITYSGRGGNQSTKSLVPSGFEPSFG